MSKFPVAESARYTYNKHGYRRTSTDTPPLEAAYVDRVNQCLPS